jgi:hypothetical protein
MKTIITISSARSIRDGTYVIKSFSADSPGSWVAKPSSRIWSETAPQQIREL